MNTPLMADAFTTITTLIQTPPGQLAAGGILAGFIWQGFVWFESDLTEMKKFEIAVWLVGIEPERNAKQWVSVTSSLFYRLFGDRQLSWKCISRSILFSACVFAGEFILSLPAIRKPPVGWHWMEAVFIGSTLCDFASLYVTRCFLVLMQRKPKRSIAILLGDFLSSIGFAFVFWCGWIALFIRLHTFGSERSICRLRYCLR